MTSHHTNQGLSKKHSGLLVLEDGTLFKGWGAGYMGTACGEVCFNTAMTGYQEILTDPSYDQQIICFTFPHIGNTGINSEDSELSFPEKSSACGMLLREKITSPSNWRSDQHFSDWLIEKRIIALYGIDTRQLTKKIREKGLLNGLIAHQGEGEDFPIETYLHKVREWKGLSGKDLANLASLKTQKHWTGTPGQFSNLFTGKPESTNLPEENASPPLEIAVIDFGVKTSILNSLSSLNAKVTIYPGQTKAETILRQNPDGIVLTNGPGDPEATIQTLKPQLQALIQSRVPILGICLGHQLLALSLGGKTLKMKQGHHGANHPVKNLETGQVEIVSMNHGFAVDADSLPETVKQTHISLFDGSNCGLRLKNYPVLSVQHHPEASPGPHDCRTLFIQFAKYIKQYARQAEI